MSDDTQDNIDRELFRNIERLRQLRIEHRDLDEVITRLSMDIHVDQLQLKRLKKRKLMLKDQIERWKQEQIARNKAKKDNQGGGGTGGGRGGRGFGSPGGPGGG